MDGNLTPADTMDICVRAVSVGSLHKAYPITVSIGTGAAALLPGTIVNDLVKPEEGQSIVRLGHASGVTAVDIKIDGDHVIKADHSCFRRRFRACNRRTRAACRR